MANNLIGNSDEVTKIKKPEEKMPKVEVKARNKMIVLKQGENEILIDTSKLEDLTIEMKDEKKKNS